MNARSSISTNEHAVRDGVIGVALPQIVENKLQFLGMSSHFDLTTDQTLKAVVGVADVLPPDGQYDAVTDEAVLTVLGNLMDSRSQPTALNHVDDIYLNLFKTHIVQTGMCLRDILPPHFHCLDFVELRGNMFYVKARAGGDFRETRIND